MSDLLMKAWRPLPGVRLFTLGEDCVLSGVGDALFIVNHTAGQFWNVLLAGGTPQCACELLGQWYGLDWTDLCADLDDILSEAAALGLVGRACELLGLGDGLDALQGNS